LAGEYFQKLAGIRPNHLPYEGREDLCRKRLIEDGRIVLKE
jgi:hypothetical protein